MGVRMRGARTRGQETDEGKVCARRSRRGERGTGIGRRKENVTKKSWETSNRARGLLAHALSGPLSEKENGVRKVISNSVAPNATSGKADCARGPRSLAVDLQSPADGAILSLATAS